MLGVWRRADAWLTGLVWVLIAVGIVMIAAATAHSVPGQPWYFVERQLLWVALGLVAMTVTMSLDYHRLVGWGTGLYVLSLALLAVVLVHGHQALGAQRWIQIGPFPLQPSELAKVALVVGLASLLERRAGRLGRLRDLLVPSLYTALPMILVMKQPDLGTALVFVIILVGMLYMAGAPIRNLLLLYGGGFLMVVALIGLHLKAGIPLPFIKDYQLRRLIIFVNPNLDRLGAGYNIVMSEMVLGSGGLWGTGLYGNWDQLTFLPEHHTDFIFAVVGMDLGFVGATALLLLYLLLIWRILSVVAEAPDVSGSLLAAGVGAVMVAHVLMNAGMSMGVMPVVGVPLPFVSYGGSSLLTNMVGIGIVQSVYRKRHQTAFSRAA